MKKKVLVFKVYFKCLNIKSFQKNNFEQLIIKCIQILIEMCLNSCLFKNTENSNGVYF